MVPQIKLQLFLKGVRQVDVARSAFVDRAYINRVVNGHQKPSKRVVQVFKDVAGIDIEGMQ